MKRIVCLIKGHRLWAAVGYEGFLSARCMRCDKNINFVLAKHWNWLTKRIA